MGGGGKGGDGGASAARAEEAARQARIKDGTAKINSIFDGGDTATGKLTSYSQFDPSQTYYNADGTVYTTPYKDEQTITGYNSDDGGSQYPIYANTGKKVVDSSAVQGLINSGKLYSGISHNTGFNDAFYQKQAQNYLDFATPQLQDQYNQAQKQLAFSLDRSGVSDSSIRAQKEAELQKLYDTNVRQLSDTALNYENSAKSNVEDARASLINQLNNNADVESAVNGATSRAAALSAPTGYSALGQMFSTFLNGLGNYTTASNLNSLVSGSGSNGTTLYNTGSSGVQVKK